MIHFKSNIDEVKLVGPEEESTGKDSVSGIINAGSVLTFFDGAE